MNARRIALLLVFLAAAVLVGIWLLSGVGRRDVAAGDPGRVAAIPGGDTGAAAPLPEAGLPPGEEVAREAAAVADEEEPPEYRRALGGLTGRLVWQASREPIPGVEIVAIETWLDTLVPTFDTLLGLAEGQELWLFRGKARTGQDGRFVLPGVHSRAFVFLGIGLRSDKAALRFVDRMPGRGETVDLGDIALLERGTVIGRVVDAGGVPVAGARVRVVDIPSMLLQFGVAHYDPEGLFFVTEGMQQLVMPLPRAFQKHDADLPFGDARTDADGRFVVAGVRPGQSTASIHAPQREPLLRPLLVRAGGTHDLGTLRLREGSTLEGRFLDTAGNPVTGLRVSAGNAFTIASIGFMRKPTEVDAEGRFRFTGLSRGRIWLAYQRGEGEAWELKGPYQDSDKIEVRLPGLHTAVITVCDRQGSPLDDASLSLQPAIIDELLPGLAPRLPAARYLVKDRERKGRWSVQGVPAGSYIVAARAKGHAPAAVQLALGPDVAPTETRIELARAPRQRFEVMNRDKAPVAGARIYWKAEDGRGPAGEQQGHRLSATPILLGRTDRQGVLESENVEDGATGFFVRHPAYSLAHSGEQPVREGVPMRFVLQAGGHIEGQLRERGNPPAQIHVVMAAPSWEESRHFEGVLLPRFTHALPDGSFHFRHLDPGMWEIQVVPKFSEIATLPDLIRRAEQGVDVRSSENVQVTEGAVARVTLEMAAPADETGAGQIVGSVRLGGEPAKDAWVQAWSEHGRRRVEVDASGTFTLGGLADGAYHVQVERTGHDGVLSDRLWQGPIEIRNSERKTLHLDFRVAPVRLELLDPQGQPVRGTMMHLVAKEGEGGERQFESVTDADGRAEFASVPEGSYEVLERGNRDAAWVLPRTLIDVVPGGGERLHRIRGIPAITVRGTVRYDFSELNAEQREYAAQRKPHWITLQSPGRPMWLDLEEGDDGATFKSDGMAPGVYEVNAWGEWQWSCPPLTVPEGGLDRAELVLKPDKAQLVARMAQKDK